MKKIVFFVNGHTSKNQISGGDVRFREMLKRMRPFKKYVVTSKFGYDMYEKENLDAKYFLTSEDTKNHSVISLYLTRSIKSLFLDIDISDQDIIYSVSDFLPNIIPAFVLKQKHKNVKWVVCIYLIVPELFKDYTERFTEGSNFSIPSFSRFFYYLNQQLTVFLAKRWSDKIFVLNKIDKDYLIEKKDVNQALVHIVNGGIDYKRIKDISPKDAKHYDAIFLGRFHPQKGIFDLIRIWKLVCEKRPDSRLGIIGSGSRNFQYQLNKLIHDNDISQNIELLGLESGDAKFCLLKSSHIFVCPSSYESWGIVIAEAMACGLPVVAYDLPVYESIYGNNILKVPIGNLEQFAENILKLLNDEQLRDSIRFKGREFVKKYDWDMIAERELELLKNMQ